jgi:uncharacterized membrane protein YdjX (TVP38/TMEM64 family)
VSIDGQGDQRGAARSTRHAPLVALALAGAAVAAAVGLAVTGALPGPADIEAFLLERGAWGPVAFVGSMTAGMALGIPGMAWMVPAGLVWPYPAALALSWLGVMSASVVGFVFARWVGRDWVAARIPPRLAALDLRLGHQGLRPVIVLRILTGGLAPADWLLGVSSVPWRTFLVGTAIGSVPGVFMAVVAGGGLAGWALDQPGPVLAGVAAAGVAGLVAAVLLRHRFDAAARRWRRPARR